MTRHCCSVLLCCKIIKHKNTILSHTKKLSYKSNCNSNNCKISHLPFEMLCYSTENENPNVLGKLYSTPMPNIVISTFAASFPIFWKGQKEEIQEAMISNGCKYQWNRSIKNNTKCYIYHLLCFVAIPSS